MDSIGMSLRQKLSVKRNKWTVEDYEDYIKSKRAQTKERFENIVKKLQEQDLRLKELEKVLFSKSKTEYSDYYEKFCNIKIQ